MSHDLCLYSRYEEFPLVGNPDAEDLGLGRSTVLSGNDGVVVAWYMEYCRALGWSKDDWLVRLTPPTRFASDCRYEAERYEAENDVENDAESDEAKAESDSWAPSPEWAEPDPVARHIAMVDAFLAFAPDAKFGAS
jgi:hypothetical protein